MISLPVGFDASALVADFVTIGGIIVTIAGLFCAYRLIVKAIK